MYFGDAKKLLEKFGIEVGDYVAITSKDYTVTGIIMPRSELGDDEHIIIKLDNGYNIGININKIEKIERIKHVQIKNQCVKRFFKQLKKKLPYYLLVEL